MSTKPELIYYLWLGRKTAKSIRKPALPAFNFREFARNSSRSI
jgi:hypothetical protein